MTADVFISYSQPDRECALDLVTHLEAGGIDCWIAPRDVTPGEDWAAEIIKAIGSARFMVLVFSTHSNASAQVRREVERAVHKNVRIVPFRIDEVLPSDSLEYFLSTQHWLDAFSSPRHVHYQKVCDYLRARLQTTEEIQAAPANAKAPRQAARFDISALHSIERALAQHIGPIAGLMTRRAATRAVDVRGLCSQLAQEISAETARAQFIESCRSLAEPGN